MPPADSADVGADGMGIPKDVGPALSTLGGTLDRNAVRPSLHKHCSLTWMNVLLLFPEFFRGADQHFTDSDAKALPPAPPPASSSNSAAQLYAVAARQAPTKAPPPLSSSPDFAAWRAAHPCPDPAVMIPLLDPGVHYRCMV